MTKLDDFEDRARRSNLVLFGLKDRERETWAESEACVLQFCSKELEISLDAMDIERAHRLGKYNANKNRPVIIKFAHFKVRENVLSSGRKLKGSNYRISEDYSPNTLKARKLLGEFGRAQQQPYKLRHDKLIIGNKTFIYDHKTNKVVLRPLNT